MEERPQPPALIGELDRLLTTERFGRTVHWYARLDSTNGRAARLAAEGAPEGTLVIAEEQLRGRGRHRRSWHSPPGLGWYLSLILRPGEEMQKAPLQTFAAAVALTEVIRTECGLPATIRWPNDILIRGRKTAGILAEGRSSGATLRDLVIGIGWNLEHRAEDFPPGLRERATSVRAEGGRPVPRVPLLAGFLQGWETRYRCLASDGPGPLLEAWSRLSPESSGSRIRLDDGARVRTGRTRGIDPEGALLVEDDRGRVNAFRFGEVRQVLEVQA